MAPNHIGSPTGKVQFISISTAVPKSNSSGLCNKCRGAGKVRLNGMDCVCYQCRGTGKSAGTLSTK
jgi:DnaJ-class molecular chaperone